MKNPWYSQVGKWKDVSVVSKKLKLVDKKIILIKRKKEEVIKCINDLNKDAQKV